MSISFLHFIFFFSCFILSSTSFSFFCPFLLVTSPILFLLSILLKLSLIVLIFHQFFPSLYTLFILLLYSNLSLFPIHSSSLAYIYSLFPFSLACLQSAEPLHLFSLCSTEQQHLLSCFVSRLVQYLLVTWSDRHAIDPQSCYLSGRRSICQSKTRSRFRKRLPRPTETYF